MNVFGEMAEPTAERTLKYEPERVLSPAAPRRGRAEAPASGATHS